MDYDGTVEISAIELAEDEVSVGEDLDGAGNVAVDVQHHGDHSHIREVGEEGNAVVFVVYVEVVDAEEGSADGVAAESSLVGELVGSGVPEVAGRTVVGAGGVDLDHSGCEGFAVGGNCGTGGQLGGQGHQEGCDYGSEEMWGGHSGGQSGKYSYLLLWRYLRISFMFLLCALESILLKSGLAVTEGVKQGLRSTENCYFCLFKSISRPYTLIS